MKPLVIAAVMTACLAASAHALSPQERSYLAGLRIDPNSRAVAVAEAAGVIRTTFRGEAKEFSLSGLIAQGNTPKGVACFITTRDFIAKLKANFNGTAIPKVNYDAIYLTSDERGLVADKLLAGL